MAKASSDNEDSDLMSEDSVGHLADVKRGKPRKFVLITKGMNVVSLLVYKKGSLESYKKQAKESGRGTIAYGVVTGRGEDIRFQLSRSEGFTREPVKPLILKSYLLEKAGFKCKPAFDLVAEYEPSLDPDDHLSARFLALRATVEQACTGFPDRASEIQTASREIARLLDEDASSDVAYGKLEAFEKLLATLLLGATPPSTAGTKGTAPPEPDVELGKFNQRLSNVLKQATPFAATIGPSWKSLAEAGRAAAAEKKFDLAHQALARMVELIQTAKKESVSSQVTNDVSQLSDRLKVLLTQARQVTEPSLVAEIKLKASQTQAFLGKPDVVEAARLIDELAALIAPQGGGRVASPKVLEIWRDAREMVLERVGRLQEVLRKQPDKRFHVVADKGLNGLTGRLQVGLHVALMEYDQAGPNEKEPLRAKALRAAGELDTFLNTDGLVKLVDENPFRLEIGLRKDLSRALQQVSAALGG